jgi:hypothetical protein
MLALLHSFHVTFALRNDDMWLLSIVPMDGGGLSRKWVNWRDLYYPGGFIKCCSPQSSRRSHTTNALWRGVVFPSHSIRFVKNKGSFSAMAHEVRNLLLVSRRNRPFTCHVEQVAQRDDLFKNSAFVRGPQHAVDPKTHSLTLNNISADPKMTWINAAIGLLTGQGQASGDGSRDECSEAVVCCPLCCKSTSCDVTCDYMGRRIACKVC